MADDIFVRYKFTKEYDDLVCDVTEFMDNYLLGLRQGNKMFCTYIYNDLMLFSENILQLAFRVPGATRGSFLLKRLSTNKFKIVGFHFNKDVSFGEFACYDSKLQEDIDKYMNSVLNFSNVELKNNYEEYTY